jgi:hypothetical protein
MSRSFHISSAHLILLSLAWIPARAAVNDALWALGLVLQIALAAVVFRRGIARRFPCFAALVCFYPLRAGLLFALAARLDADAFNSLFSVLAFAEILLQGMLAIELIWVMIPRADAEARGILRRGGRVVFVLLISLGAAGALTWLTLNTMPAHSLVDRLQVYAWFVMIALFFAALKYSQSTNPIPITAGFAAFSLVQIATLFGRAHAFLKHDAARYLAWSYAPAIAYLVVVVFWLIALRKEPRSIARALSA